MATVTDSTQPATPPRAGTEYLVRFPNRDHHEADVAALFLNLAPGPLTVRMARSSPGRYALHEFARNLYRVCATDGRGSPLALTRPDEHSWLVHDHDGTVRFSYTVFGDHADGTYNGIDNSHAHLQIPATFVYSPELVDEPYSVQFALPEGAGWTIATTLRATDDPCTFTAPNLHAFMDGPVELSNHVVREWGPYRLVVHHEGTDDDVDFVVTLLQRIIAQHEAVFGELPNFEGGRYVFMVDALPWVFDDAMEHRNCCVLTVPGALKSALAQVLGKASHEFFHAWCIERLRPRSLEPFDYTRTNPSPELWFGEGFASYYGPIAITRAGLGNLEHYARTLGPLLNAVINSPGRQHGSVVEMSMRAPFTDAALFVDASAHSNSHTPYEAWGALLALALDLRLRTEKSSTLDQYMRRLWHRFGRPETPFTNADLEAVLGEVASDAEFAHTFFQQFVYGTELPDFTGLLARAGLLLRHITPHTPTLGTFWGGMQDGRLVVGSHTAPGSPLYAAGIDRGDSILDVAGTAIHAPGDVQNSIAGKTVGESIEIRYIKRGELRTRRVVLAQNSALELIQHEAAGLPVTPAMRQLRAEWLSVQ